MMIELDQWLLGTEVSLSVDCKEVTDVLCLDWGGGYSTHTFVKTYLLNSTLGIPFYWVYIIAQKS